MAAVTHSVSLDDLDDKTREEVRLIEDRADQVEEAEQITILEDDDDGDEDDSAFWQKLVDDDENDEDWEVDELGLFINDPILQAQTAAKFTQIMQS